MFKLIEFKGRTTQPTLHIFAQTGSFQKSLSKEFEKLPASSIITIHPRVTQSAINASQFEVDSFRDMRGFDRISD